MKKTLLLIVFSLVFGTMVGAQEIPFELIYKGDEVTQAEPGEAISAVFLLRNTINEKYIVDLIAELPEDWKLVTIDEEINLAGDDFQILIVSFVAPLATPAGRFTASFTARLREAPELVVRHTVIIQIQERISVDIHATETSTYIIAGQRISGEFHIVNNSNTTISLEFEARSSERYELEIDGFDGDYMTLEIGESESIVVHGRSEDTEGRLLRHRTRVTAHILKSDGSRNADYPPLRAETGVDILPKTTVAGDSYHRLPISWSLVQRNEFGAEWSGDAALQLEGTGSLDEAGKHDIDFIIAKRMEIPPEAFTHPNDLYRFTYTTSWLEVLFGDGSFNLSRLTEANGRGQGVSVDVALGSFGVRTYYHQSYWADPVLHNIGGQIGYQLKDAMYPEGTRYRIEANVLGVVQQSIVMSINQLFLPVPAVSVYLEAALGNSTNDELDFAIAGGGAGTHNWISYALETAYAGPQYSGQIGDLFYINANIDQDFFGRALELDTIFSYSKQNLLLSDELPDAPQSWEMGLKTRYTAPVTSTKLSAGWSLNSRKDLLDNIFDTVNNKIQIEATQPIDTIQFKMLTDVQITRDRLYTETSSDQTYSLAFSNTPNDSQVNAFSFTYNGLFREGQENVHALSWATGVDFELKNFDIGFYLTNRTEYPSTKSELGVALDMSFSFGLYGKLVASGDYGLELQPGDVSQSGKATIQYNGSFLLPIGRKSGTGAVRGTVKNVLTGEPMHNVVVRLEENAAVTDRRGRFLFPAVKEGNHYLDVDASLTQSGLVPLIATPTEVSVESQKDTVIEIPMGKLSSIAGTIIRYDFADEAEKFNSVDDDSETFEIDTIEPMKRATAIQFSRTGLVSGILVELEKDGKIQRRVSDIKGEFLFEDIAPGVWNIKIYTHLLPDYTYAAEKSFSVDLVSDTEEIVRFDILPTKREIRIIGGGEL